MNSKELLGLKVKEYRKKKKITQEQLSEIIGLDNGYISKLEVGQNFPSLTTLEKIAAALGVQLSDFFQFSPPSEQDFKTEVLTIYEKLPKDKQYTLYRVAKGLL